MQDAGLLWRGWLPDGSPGAQPGGRERNWEVGVEAQADDVVLTARQRGDGKVAPEWRVLARSSDSLASIGTPWRREQAPAQRIFATFSRRLSADDATMPMGGIDDELS